MKGEGGEKGQSTVLGWNATMGDGQTEDRVGAKGGPRVA